MAGLRIDTAWLRERDSARDPAPDAGRLGVTVLTSGVVIWLMQSSFLASLLILGLPLWRHVDLLAIVERAADLDAPSSSRAADSNEDRVLGGVLGARNDPRANAAGRT